MVLQALYYSIPGVALGLVTGSLVSLPMVATINRFCRQVGAFKLQQTAAASGAVACACSCCTCLRLCFVVALLRLPCHFKGPFGPTSRVGPTAAAAACYLLLAGGRADAVAACCLLLLLTRYWDQIRQGGRRSSDAARRVGARNDTRHIHAARFDAGQCGGGVAGMAVSDV